MGNNGCAGRHDGSVMRGGITVEAIVVVPLIVLVGILIFQLGFLAHERAVLQHTISDAAASLARSWRTSADPALLLREGEWSPEAMAERNPYWQMTTILTDEHAKCERAEAFLKELLNRQHAWVRGGETKVWVRVRGGIPFAMLKVEASVPAPVPLARIASLFGASSPLRITAQAESMVLDHKSFLQDTDWGLQMLQQTSLGAWHEKMAKPVQEMIGTLQTFSGTNSKAP